MRFLSRAVASATAAASTPSRRVGSPACASRLLDELAQRVLPGEPQGGQQPEADRLAVAIARVAGGGLDRVADRVAEVERLARAAVALVGGHDAQLGAHAADDHVVVDRAAGRDAVPQRPAGDERGLDHLGVAGGELGGGQRGQQRRIGEHRDRLVVGADVVLGLGQVDPGLAAVGGVDLGHERGRHLHDGDAALVGGRAEAREVAHHAAAQRHDVVGAGGALRDERVPDPLGRRERLVLLARRDLDEAGGIGDAPGVQRGDGLVADDHAAPAAGHGARSSGPTHTG